VGKGMEEGGGVRVAAGHTSGGAGSRPGGAVMRGRGGAPGSSMVARGPCLESVGRPGEKEIGRAQGEQYSSQFI
jgi:hypothetical protein